MTCLRCKMEIVYHAYGDRCAKPWGEFRPGDTIAPLCLKCYCELTAEKILKSERVRYVRKKTESVSCLVTQILNETGMSKAALGRTLGVSHIVIGRWQREQRCPYARYAKLLKAFAKERGIAA